jgi:hypothetical protein
VLAHVHYASIHPRALKYVGIAQAAAQPGMRYSVVTELMLRLLVRLAFNAQI